MWLKIKLDGKEISAEHIKAVILNNKIAETTKKKESIVYAHPDYLKDDESKIEIEMMTGVNANLTLAQHVAGLKAIIG